VDKNSEFRTVRGYQMIRQQNSASGLTPSMEDYLEMIYRLSQTDGYVRVNSLAEMLNVQSPSVTRTVQKLSEMEYVKYHRYGIIQLTEQGAQLGSYLLTRHETIELFLRNIGAGDSLFVDAELIEHHMSKKTVRQLELLNSWFAQPKVLQQLHDFMAAHEQAADQAQTASANAVQKKEP
jgi:Mn-dependent DtxR family transcriptional regulator